MGFARGRFRRRRADGYRYDVVNLTRQVFCNFGNDLAARMESAATQQDPAEFRRTSQRFFELGRDLDELLGTRREFLLGSWIEQARSWGATTAEADYFEANAREILTAWHEPGGPLTDYASRQWNGLMRDYYLPRWAKWISLTTARLERGEAISDAAYLTSVNDACEKWIHAHADYATTPQGDPVETARRLYAKYRAEIIAADRMSAAGPASDGPPKADGNEGRDGPRLTVSETRAGAIAGEWERYLAAP